MDRRVVAAGVLGLAGAGAYAAWDRSRPAPDGAALAMKLAQLQAAYEVTELQADHHHAEGLAADGDGVLVLATANPDGKAERTWLLALDGAGATRWERLLTVEEGAGRAIVATEGGYVVAGSLAVGTTAYQARLLRLGPDGAVLDGRTLGDAGVTGFGNLAILPDGRIVAGGSTAFHGWIVEADASLAPLAEHTTDLGDDVLAVAALAEGYASASAIETSTTVFGRTSVRTDGWVASLPPEGRGEPAAIVADTAGLVVAGNAERDDAAFVTRLDTTGHVVWDRRLSTPGEIRRASALAAAPDGGVVVAGTRIRPLDQRDAFVALLAADRSVVWDRAYGTDAYEYTTAVIAVDGGFVVAGATTAGPSRTNVWVFRLDRLGNLVWERAVGGARG